MRVTSYSLVIYKYVTKLMQAYKLLQNWRTQALTENMGKKMWIFFSRLYFIYRKHIMSFYDGWYTNVTTSKLILLILIIPLSLLNHRHTFVCIFYILHIVSQECSHLQGWRNQPSESSVSYSWRSGQLHFSFLLVHGRPKSQWWSIVCHSKCCSDMY